MSDPELTEPWRPELAPPARPNGVPADATWDEEGWRWSAGKTTASGGRDGTWRFWAMNGTLLGERIYVAGTERSSLSLYPDGSVAARTTQLEDDVVTHECFWADGKPWCTARYRGVIAPTIPADDVLLEKLHRRDGTLHRETDAKTGEVRHYDEHGALELVVRGTKVVLPKENGREITLRAADGDLGTRLFEATIEGEPRPDVVKKLAAEHAWAERADEEAPFAHASIAHFLTALGSRVPRVAELGVVGLGNLVDDDNRAAVLPVIEALAKTAPYAKEALEQLGHTHPHDHDEEEEAHEAGEEVALGQVTLPSGDLVVVDMGAMGQWSHDAPHHADISGSAWATVAGKSRDDFVDLVVKGAHARDALAAFVKEHGAGDLFDVDRAAVDETKQHFRSHAESMGLRAELEVAPARIGHGARLRLLKEAGLAFADFGFAHVNVIGVFGLPKDRELSVVGVRDDEGTWERVSLVVKPSEAVDEEEIASLSVEEARFMFADADALRAWTHERSVDGLRDLVFWGGAEDDLAEATGAELAYPAATYLGWADLPPGACPPHFVHRVIGALEQGSLCVELRAHSSHHAILRGAWASPHEAGTATIGGAKMCGVFTQVGDGVFPVVLERDADGEVCRVSVVITGAEDDS